MLTMQLSAHVHSLRRNNFAALRNHLDEAASTIVRLRFDLEQDRSATKE